MGKLLVLLLIAALLTTHASTAIGEIRYSITDLGNLGGVYSDPWAINQHGDVAGESFLDIRQHAFRWTPASGMTDLTALAGNSGTFGSYAGAAYALNDHGQVAGYAYSSEQGYGHAFVWSADAGMTDLGTLGGTSSHAKGINQNGQVVGDAATPGPGPVHAFIWSPATGMQDLGALAGNSWATAINDHGQVVGHTTTPQFVERAFVWSASTGMVPLGTLGGRHSYAYDINNLGQVVGEAATAEGDGNQQGHCFLWSESTGILDLGTLGGPNSVAYGINDDGSIVGDADVAFNTPHPFLYDGLTMRDLNTLIDPSSGWLLGHARAINNVGQIVVDGSITSEPWRHALLLTPVPEAAGTLLAVCTLAIAVSRRPS